MWLVRKHSTPSNPGASELPEEEASALRAVWRGDANDGEKSRALETLERARRFENWIACDCRADDNVFPVLAPAYLTEYRTYFLKRLSYGPHPQHATTCIFYRDADETNFARMGTVRVERPDGRFAIELPAQNAMRSQLTVASSPQSARRAHDAASTMARQLWRLMDEAELSSLSALRANETPSYRAEFGALNYAAKQLQVAPELALSSVFSTFAGDVANRSIFAKIHTYERQFGKHDPEGYLCIYAREVTRDAVSIGGDEPIRPINGVEKLGPDGPFLVLVLVGPRRNHGLRVLRAVAQPILSAHAFFPVKDDASRALIRALLRWRESVMESVRPVGVTIRRDLFGDAEVNAGTLVLSLIDTSTGEIVGADANISSDAAPIDDILGGLNDWMNDAVSSRERL